ncbi:MAG: O-antigen ligase family protein [Microbacterium sp.]|uniref:O-antigen ligase family protein n=1 Tax=Microbacterium sp. TaxID=51671 RepID=UPI0039E5C73B
MTAHTTHPAWPVPAAPERERTGHLLLRAWCVFVLFAAFAAPAWVEAFGPVVAGLVAAAAAIVSAAVWMRVRPAFNGRRLPWFVLAYVAWAGLSLLWSGQPATTWALLALTAGQGLFVAAVLTWRELVAAVGAALKWMLGLSLVFELVVAVVVGAPLGAGFAVPADAASSPWSLGGLFRGGPLLGLAGDAAALGAVSAVAVIVFGIRVASAIARVPAWLWLALAFFLLVRSESVIASLALGAVAAVLVTVLLMRTAGRAGERTKYYLLFTALGAVAGVLLWWWRDVVFAGAHSVWADAAARTGWVGVVLVAGIQLSFVWRAWFFAIDRPRWDLRADRPYTPLTLLPTLTATVLLVQGLADVGPLGLWGWLLIVTLGTKITQAPLVGVGPAEQSAALERGEAVTA